MVQSTCNAPFLRESVTQVRHVMRSGIGGDGQPQTFTAAAAAAATIVLRIPAEH